MKLLVMSTNNLYGDKERIAHIYDYALKNAITDIYILSYKIMRLTDEMIYEKNLLSPLKCIPENGVRTHLFLGTDDSMMFNINAFRAALAERKDIELLVEERYALNVPGRKIYLVNKQYDEAAFKDDEWMDFRESAVIYRSEKWELENWKNIIIAGLSDLGKDTGCLEFEIDNGYGECMYLLIQKDVIEREFLFSL